MAGIFHEGERAVQARAGVGHMARRVANGIHHALPPAAAEFLLTQPFAVLGARDGAGRVWASPVWGPPGFLRAADEATLIIAAHPAPGDPLAEQLIGAGGPVGLLVIEPESRRRMRVNGVARALPHGDGLQICTEQVYANCPKYIQKRERADGPPPPSVAQPRPVGPSAPREEGSRRGESVRTVGNRLDAAQKAWVGVADTFFIATAHPNAGADASHRGGNPGFVAISDDGKTLLWPDYSGNAMFNTLGNLQADPSAGLLFLDWERGGILQITGEAEIVWDGPRVERFPGAERAVSFRVTEVAEAPVGTLPLRYRLVEYSRFNPK
jgi:predicted pyridoxine 5'-phosphate oxidase superfamily flavin-nucleotide-binding protein